MKLINKISISIFILTLSLSSLSCGLLGNTESNLKNAQIWSQEVDYKTQNYRDMYSKAIKYKNNEDFKAAYDTFNQIDNRYDIIYDYVLFNKAQSAKSIPNEQAVIDSLKELLANYKNSKIADIATYNLGQTYVRLSKDEEAKRYFEQTINNFPHTDYAIASHYYLGEIYAKNKNKKQDALIYFQKYLQNAYDGKFGLNAVNGILNLSDIRDLTKEDIQNIGLAYYNAGSYSKALDFLTKNINKKTWFPIGKSYIALKDNDNAESSFTYALSTFDNLDKDEVYDALTFISGLRNSDKKAWEYCEKKFPNYADVALYFKAKYLKPNEKYDLFQTIIKNYPESNYAPEASWQIFWSLYTSSKYSLAISFAESIVKTYPESKSIPKVVYWTGKSYEKAGQKTNAIKVYERLLSIFPGDYYYHRAKGRLNELKYGLADFQWNTNSKKIYKTSWNKQLPFIYNYASNTSGADISELLYLKDWQTVELINNSKKDPVLKSFLDLQNGNFSISIIAIRDSKKNILSKPPGKDDVWKLLYPLHENDLISKYSKINDIDVMLVQALTREESYFNTKAVSISNAKGLMQLIPSTAQAVADWERLPFYTNNDLFDKQTNVRLGTRYLKYTHSRFNGNSMLAVAAYNGGPGSVNKWLSNIKKDDWDQFIENINYDETRNYIKKVFSSYWNYKEIYK